MVDHKRLNLEFCKLTFRIRIFKGFFSWFELGFIRKKDNLIIRVKKIFVFKVR